MSKNYKFPSKFRTVFEKYISYLLLIPLLACVVILILALMGPAVGNVFSNIVSNMPIQEYENLPGVTPVKAQGPDHIIIREGQITLVITDTLQAKEQIKTIVLHMENQGAFIISDEETANDYDRPPTIHLVIRVPAQSFSDVMDQIAHLAQEVEGRAETAQDVTEEYYDQQERLKSMEIALERLRQIMVEAKNVDDLLKAEDMVTKRETEIEAIKGKLEYLSRASSLSKIDISLYPPAPKFEPIPEVWLPSKTVLAAVDDLIHSIQGVIDALLYFIIAVLPWLLLIGLLVYLGWRIFKWISLRQQSKATHQEPPA